MDPNQNQPILNQQMPPLNIPPMQSGGGSSVNKLLVVIVAILIIVLVALVVVLFTQQKAAPSVKQIQVPPAQITVVPTVATSPATIEEDINNIDVGSVEGDLKDVKTDMQGL